MFFYPESLGIGGVVFLISALKSKTLSKPSCGIENSHNEVTCFMLTDFWTFPWIVSVLHNVWLDCPVIFCSDIGFYLQRWLSRWKVAARKGQKVSENRSSRDRQVFVDRLMSHPYNLGEDGTVERRNRHGLDCLVKKISRENVYILEEILQSACASLGPGCFNLTCNPTN